MAILHLVACGTPTPSKTRFGSCYVLQFPDECLMFDCGPAATWKLTAMDLHPSEVKSLFFTHHHYDHDADYPCFLLCRWDHCHGEGELLKVYGPPPTALLTERLIGPEGAFSFDWRARVGHPASQEVYAKRGGVLPRTAPRVELRELGGGDRVQGLGYTVTVAQVPHLEPFMATLAYRVDWEGGSLVVAGDCGPSPALERLAAGAATLIVNCRDHQAAMSPTLAAGITGTTEAAALAQRTGAARLILAHQGPDLCLPGSRERGMAEVAASFAGEAIFGEEGMSLFLD